MTNFPSTYSALFVAFFGFSTLICSGRVALTTDLGLQAIGCRRLLPRRWLNHELHTMFHIVVNPLHDGAPLAPASVAVAQTQMASAARVSFAPHPEMPGA